MIERLMLDTGGTHSAGIASAAVGTMKVLHSSPDKGEFAGPGRSLKHKCMGHPAVVDHRPEAFLNVFMAGNILEFHGQAV